MALLLIIGLVLVGVGYYLSSRYKGEPMIHWPFLGMLPDTLLNLHRPYHMLTEIARASNSTFQYRGVWFSGTDMLLTVDPANVHYIMTLHFPNFPKGSKFRSIFDVLGDGIFNSDHDSWRAQRKMARELMISDNFFRFLTSTNLDKAENGLLPMLAHFSARGVAVDLQDLLQRFTFDVTSILVSGYDPRSLSADLPETPYIKAMDDVEEALIFRHIFPESVWKLMRRVNVGPEKKLIKGWRDLDRIINGYISKKRQEVTAKKADDDSVDMLSSLIRQGFDDGNFLRDAVVNFMTAGRDTTSAALSWFFWLLSQHPDATKKMRQELEGIDFDYRRPELTKLAYLHGALCETLRLYPPVPFQHKSPLEADTLPTGHRVDPGSTILFSLYAMGRMRSVWGEDCEEFKPERWISSRGGTRHEAAYKFLAFNAGPRTCIGREWAFTQMKMVVAAILGKYEIQMLEGQNVVPCLSIILHMKHGLLVKLTKLST